jgi:NADP-dependent 3-hydroxy acid dehydrogenase YdfG
VLPFMKKMNRGNVIVMSSKLAFEPKPKAAVYCATKYALQGKRMKGIRRKQKERVERERGRKREREGEERNREKERRERRERD